MTVDPKQLPQPILADHPEWVDLYYRAWEIAASHIRVGKGGRAYMDAAWDPARDFQWVWDTCFMTLYCRYAPEQYPGIQSLDNFYDLQRDDGYISMTYDMTTGEEPYPDRINPPLFAWVEWEYYLATGDASRFERVVPHIERLMDWIDANRRTQPHRRLINTKLDGKDRIDTTNDLQLYYFADCGSSGMDDSPRTPRVAEAGQFYDWIDLSSQMALSFRLLGEMHRVIGGDERAAHWSGRAHDLGALINNELWCERTQFYHDRTLPKNFVAHKTVAAFWPLLAGICPEERVDALVAHLLDEGEFNRPTPVPTLSADDLNYDPRGTYWVGGVWAPTNYMITRGLMAAGRGDVAHQIAMKYVGALACTYASFEPHTLWECYSPEEDKPGLAAYTYDYVKPEFVGWTGLGPTAMLIESIIGLDINVPAGRVEWTIRLTGEHGVRNLSLGEHGRADFTCSARSSVESPAAVEVTADQPLTVTITRGDRTTSLSVHAGAPAVATV